MMGGGDIWKLHSLKHRDFMEGVADCTLVISEYQGSSGWNQLLATNIDKFVGRAQVWGYKRSPIYIIHICKVMKTEWDCSYYNK